MIKHKIGLHGMEFFAFHGLHPEETTNGNKFIVDVEVETDFTKAALSDDISGTFDYEQIYAIVEQEMKITSKLLEHLAERILMKLKLFPATAFSIKVSVAKMNPPLKGVTAKSFIEICYKKK